MHTHTQIFTFRSISTCLALLIRQNGNVICIVLRFIRLYTYIDFCVASNSVEKKNHPFRFYWYSFDHARPDGFTDLSLYLKALQLSDFFFSNHISTSLTANTNQRTTKTHIVRAFQTMSHAINHHTESDSIFFFASISTINENHKILKYYERLILCGILCIVN